MSDFFVAAYLWAKKWNQTQNLEEEAEKEFVEEEYQYTENNNQFCVQNIVRRAGCETFVINFSGNGGGGGGRQRPGVPPSNRFGTAQRSQSAAAPKTDSSKAKRGGKRKSGRGGESIKKEEKNEINKSLRSEQG
jgi:hypothetical protein